MLSDGHPDIRARHELWRRMKRRAETGVYYQVPRLVMGDFNDICSNEEKRGGPRRHEATFEDFLSMISVSGLHDIRTVGGFFTWAGNRYSHSIKSRIDRMMATVDWMEAYPRAYVRLLRWLGSDHRPLLLNMEDTKWKGKKFFKYDNRWKNDPDIQQLIKITWEKRCQGIEANNFSKVIVNCRDALAKWKRSQKTNSQKEIEELQRKLHQVYNSSYLDFGVIHDLKSKLTTLYRKEEEYWKAKSGMHWLKAGDKNTRFFHEQTKQRRAINRITVLEDESGKECTDPQQLYGIAEKYFHDLYTSSRNNIPDELLQGIPSLVTPEINQHLIKPVTRMEVREAVFSINQYKSPGPDGMNAGFYKNHWETIHEGIYKYVNLFFQEGYLEPELNHTNICLIPKKESPVSMKEFRPISLSNVAYKILDHVYFLGTRYFIYYNN